MNIYLDNSATTPVCRPAADEMYKMLTVNYGNPSSMHSVGLSAAAALDTARERTAKAIGCLKEEVFFSPGGTSANNTAIFSAVKLLGRRGNRIVTSSLEHPSVMECMKALEQQGFEVIRLPVDKNGLYSREDLFAAVNKKTILVSIMYVNNEIGAVNPVKLSALAVKQAGSPALIHCDAVQAFGKLPVKPSLLGVDLMTVSSHKIHGPKGAGALYIKKGLKLPGFILGGGQERSVISGTEPLPAIVGFAAAAAALPEPVAEKERIEKIRNAFFAELKNIPAVKVNSPAESLPYIINISVPGIPSEVLINFLSENGIYVSAGSACKKGHRSDVLSAIGLSPERIDSAIRISLSRFTTLDDLLTLAEKINEAVKRFKR